MRRATGLLLVSLLVLACSPSIANSSTNSQTNDQMLLQNVRLAGSPEPTSILIRGERIEAIDPNLAPVENTLDCTGLTALPGFIDTHVHLGFYSPGDLLRGGLTTVRDLGWTPSVAFGWVARSRDPDWGPKVLAAGPMLTAANGYPLRAGWAPPGTGAVYETGMITELKTSGASVVKVTLEPNAGPTLSLEQLTALVEEARRNDLEVVAHVSGLAELRKALDAGVRDFCHFVFNDEAVPDDMITEMVKLKCTVAPTLRVNPSENRLSNLRRFHHAGGRVVYGTDLGNGGRPGIDLPELALMEQAGMSRKEILRSATEFAAEHLELADRGRLEPGTYADILLVKGDPLEAWGVLEKPARVLREGRVVLP